MGVQVLTDSTSYIDKSIIDKLNIKVVSLNVKFAKESFKETELKNETFYTMMEEKGIPISSQPSVGDMYDAMKSTVETGDSLLCVFLSSKMSGTYSTAHLVKNMIAEEYKNIKIDIVDSCSNCMQLGYAAIQAAKEAMLGKNLEEVKKAALQNIARSRFLFIPDNLTYLKKGGRIGGASALIGNLLKIIPILTVENGVTTVLTKVRTKNKAVMTMVDKMMEDINNYGLGEVVIHNINCMDEAKKLAKIINEKLKLNVSICDIGPVIGLHVGPGAIGIAYYTERDMR